MKKPLLVSLLLLTTACTQQQLQESPDCAGQFVTIAQIQGNSHTSPLLGQHIITKGVVAGQIYAGTSAAAVVLQSHVPDGDKTTSEGILLPLADSGTYQQGQLIQVNATVAEQDGMTVLTEVSDIRQCAANLPVSPLEVTLPLADYPDWEALEGRWLRFPQQLVINDTYPLSRYGEIMLADERLWQATEVMEPGDNARKYNEANELRSFWLDDGLWQQNPDPILYPSGELTAQNTLRTGDQIRQVEGFLIQDKRGYKLVPTKTPEFITANPRPKNPPAKAVHQLRVASFNLLNFFTGQDPAQPFPTRRGASDQQELERQQQKLLSALSAMDADIIGLLEVENNGYDNHSALATLVTALNKQAGYQQYAFVQPQQTLGNDAIKVAMIYRPAAVKASGQAAINDKAPFGQGSRPPLAQTFTHLSSGENITVSINHFKSKGSCPKGKSANADQGDGQACWNAARTEAATALAQWLNSQPTGVNTDKQLIIGDLNAYRQEDPIRQLQQSGWHYLSNAGERQYSYVFRGRTGSLDHALATPALAAQLQHILHWAINADEPAILDYNLEYKSVHQQQSLYAPDPYRSSDHDPLIITFSF